MSPGVDLLLAANWDAAAMQFYQEFYETYNEVPELTGVMPEAPAELNQMTDDRGQRTEYTEIESTLEQEVLEPDNDLATDNEKSGQAVEVKERKLLGLGVMGATGIVLGVILLVVVLGTMAISTRRKVNL